MRRLDPIVAAAIAAAVLCNFWLLEFALAAERDTAAAWISDLASRTQPRGWAFQLLEISAGLAVACFALLARRRLAAERGELGMHASYNSHRSAGPGLLRAGFAALAVAGAATVVGGAAPLGCAEALEPGCSLAHDALDTIHSGANLVEIAALLLALGLVGVGLLREGERGVGLVALLLAADWLALSALSGLAYLLDDLDSLKGLFQRGAQLLLAAWILLAGLAVSRRAAEQAPRDEAPRDELTGL